MKKNYKVLAVKVISIVVVLAIIFTIAITYRTAENIRVDFVNETYQKESLAEKCYWIVGGMKDQSKSNILKSIYENMYMSYDHQDNGGYYCMIKDSNGNDVVYSQNYLILSIDDNEKRIALLGDFAPRTKNGFPIYEFGDRKVSIEGTCDDTFAYINKLTVIYDDSEECYEEYTYELNVDNEPENVEDINDWINGRECYVINGFYGTIYGQDDKKEKIDSEAKEFAQKAYDDYINGNTRYDYSEADNIFTCHVTHVVNNLDKYIKDGGLTVESYVAHPVAMAMSELLLWYVAIVLELLVFSGIIILF